MLEKINYYAMHTLNINQDFSLLYRYVAFSTFFAAFRCQTAMHMQLSVDQEGGTTAEERQKWLTIQTEAKHRSHSNTSGIN